jgi:hypothetical protein
MVPSGVSADRRACGAVPGRAHGFFDGKEVELGLWGALAERFVGPNLTDAIDTLGLCRRLDERYAWLRGTGRRLLRRAGRLRRPVLGRDARRERVRQL